MKRFPCTSASCGTCGGGNCAALPGGRGACCPNVIRDEGRICWAVGAPCLMEPAEAKPFLQKTKGIVIVSVSGAFVGVVLTLLCWADRSRRARNRYLSGASKLPRLSNANVSDAGMGFKHPDSAADASVCFPIKKRKKKTWRKSISDSINWGVSTLEWIAHGSHNPNSPGSPDPAMGQSPLHLAVRAGRYDAVEEKLLGGSDPNVKEQIMGRTPLHVAAIDDKQVVSINISSHSRLTLSLSPRCKLMMSYMKYANHEGVNRILRNMMLNCL